MHVDASNEECSEKRNRDCRKYRKADCVVMLIALLRVMYKGSVALCLRLRRLDRFGLIFVDFHSRFQARKGEVAGERVEVRLLGERRTKSHHTID